MKKVWDAEEAKSTIAARKQAYDHVFNPENQYLKIVLEDLAKFCRANESTFHADPRIHAALEGRREVFLRIERHIELTSEQLFAECRLEEIK